MSHESHHDLSEQGQARRDAMLAELQSRVERTARMRRMRSGVMAAAALLAIASLSVLMLPHRQNHPIATDPVSPTGQAESARHIEIVKSDPGVLDRLAVRTTSDVLDRFTAPMYPTHLVVERIDDEQLVTGLAQLGRPTGIIRSQGRVWLTAKVTDQELGSQLPSERNESSSG